MIIDLREFEKIKQADVYMPPFRSHTGNADRRAILESNRDIREGRVEGARNFGSGGGFGRVELRIPEFDYPFIKAMFPEIASHDATERTKAWQRFARSPLSEPYRLYRHKRGGANGGTQLRHA